MDIDWQAKINTAYALGEELEILGGTTSQDFNKIINIEEIVSKAEIARTKLPQTIQFYLQKGATEQFVENFKKYIEDYEDGAIGNALIENAFDKALGFSVDFKTDLTELIVEIRKIVTSVPENFGLNFVPENITSYITEINKELKKHVEEKEFVLVESFGDSYYILLVSSEGLSKNIQNPFIKFVI